MKFDRVFAVIIATIIFGVNICHAQFHLPKSGGSFTLNFIGTMPRGDFAKASTTPTTSTVYSFDNCGNATFGGGFGFKTGYKFSFGMGLIFNIEAMWNQLNKDMRTFYGNKTKPNYINFPILIGLDYKCYFCKTFGTYMEGAAGMGLLLITPEGYSNNMTKYKPSIAFAWEAGGGILLGEHFCLGVHYYMCGNHNIKDRIPRYSPEYISPSYYIHQRKQKVGILALKLGLMF